jgi:hypothetical protein
MATHANNNGIVQCNGSSLSTFSARQRKEQIESTKSDVSNESQPFDPGSYDSFSIMNGDGTITSEHYVDRTPVWPS